MPSEERPLPCAPNCRRGAHDRRCGHESSVEFVPLFESEEERAAFVAAAKGSSPRLTAEECGEAAAMLRAYQRECGDFENPLVLAGELADKLDPPVCSVCWHPLSSHDTNPHDGSRFCEEYGCACDEEVAGRKRTPPSTPAPGYESLPPGWRPDRRRSS